MTPHEFKFLLDSHDVKIMILAEQIYSDYLEILKRVVLPRINKDHNFRMRELRVLMALSYSPVSVSATDLVEQLRKDPSTITRSIDCLVSGGYVMTEENRSDGRSKNLTLTSKGKAASTECRQSLYTFFEGVRASKGHKDLPHTEEDRLAHLEASAGRAKILLSMAKK